MLVSQQIRGARYALRWSVQQLADNSGVSVSTVKRLEASDGVPSMSARNLASVKTALEAAGVEFIGSPENRPGFRIGDPPVT
ncbi:MAG: helix-turn-helix transcriptional regulator [Parasphingorhabdus sp.]